MSDETSSSKLKFLTPQQVFMLITLLSSVILSQFQPLQSRREGDPAGGVPKAGDYELSASLLEDPLEVLKPVTTEAGTLQAPDPPERSLAAWLSGHSNSKLPDAVAKAPLAAQVESRLKNDKSIQIICSLMRPEMDSMSKERRQRERLAVVSALASAGYGPESSRRLSVHRFKNIALPGSAAAGGVPTATKQEPGTRDGNVTAAYEWFRPLGSLPSVETPRHDGVCVIWFNMSEVWGEDKRATIARLRVLLAQFIGRTHEQTNGKIETAIVGPHDSDSLARMLYEAVVSQGTAVPPDSWGGPMKLACPYATASAWGIIREARLPKGKGPSDTYNPEQNRDEYQSWLSREMNDLLSGAVKDESADLFLRAPLTDDYVAEALVDELKRRGVNVDPKATAEEGDILLISEFDASYGRELPLSFLRAAGQEGDTGEWKKADSRWHWTPYARGLDGRFGRTAAPVTAAPQKDNGEIRKKPAADEPRGTVQMDALRRLAERIEDLDRERKRAGHPGIVAVGVLGADIYDKLLILRALRPLLKDAVFFTNNLDAWLWDTEELRSTRNLIVASPFGLRLADRWQAGMPPFRDSYQTSVYAGALALVTGSETLKTKLHVPSGTAEEKGKLRARLFEIGRSVPVELSLPEGGGEVSDRLHPPSERHELSARQNWQIGWLVALLAVSWILWVVASRNPVHTAYWSKLGNLDKCIWLCGVGPHSIVIVLPLAMWLACLCSGWMDHEEVFLLFSGVSSWPFFALNLTAVFVSGLLILNVLKILRKGREDMKEAYFKEEISAPSRDPKPENHFSRCSRLRLPKDKELLGTYSAQAADGIIADPAASEKDSEEKKLYVSLLWGAFYKSGSHGMRLLWAVIIMALILVGIGLLLWLLPSSGMPVRGEETRVWFCVLEWVSGTSVVLLSALVLDSLWLSRIFIDWFDRGRSAWHESVLQQYAEDDAKKPGASDYVDLLLVADWTRDMGKLTTLPFYVGGLLVVARFDCFDAWRWPVYVLGTLIFIGIFLIGTAYSVQSSAEQLREAALKKLVPDKDEKLIKKIKALSHGAFMPFSRQPVMTAVYWLVGALSLTGLWQGISQWLS